jgi:hypothetical protein
MRTVKYLVAKIPNRGKLYFGQVIFEGEIRTLAKACKRASEAEAHSRAVATRYNRMKEAARVDAE